MKIWNFGCNAVLCCKQQQKQQQQQQQKTPRAQQYTSNLLMSCAPGKLNAKHHQTTPKPEIHITVEKKAVLAAK